MRGAAEPLEIVLRSITEVQRGQQKMQQELNDLQEQMKRQQEQLNDQKREFEQQQSQLAQQYCNFLSLKQVWGAEQNRQQSHMQMLELHIDHTLEQLYQNAQRQELGDRLQQQLEQQLRRLNDQKRHLEQQRQLLEQYLQQAHMRMSFQFF
jgi:chromosome segregation ATPase